MYLIKKEDVVNKVKDIPSNKISFTALDGYNSDLYLKDGAIYYNDELIIKTSDIMLQGNHNYENVMASVMVAKRLNVSDEVIIDTLKSFKSVEHRIEFVREINGVKVKTIRSHDGTGIFSASNSQESALELEKVIIEMKLII